MTTYTTDIFLGSYPNLAQQTISVTSGATTENVTLAAGSYYLHDTDTSARSLIETLAAAIETHSVVSGAGVDILENRRIRISATQTFTLTWPVDGVLRDLLGFTGNLTPAASSHTASGISPLLWAPGRTGTVEGRLGTDGVPVNDTIVGQAATGIVYAGTHNSYRRNSFGYRYVQNSRVWTTAEAGGEFIAFWRNVLSRFARFRVHTSVVEDTVGTDPMSFGAYHPETGAYTYAPPGQPGAMPWAREFGFHEYTHPITIPAVTSPEYT